jgi:hypothetical protein
VLPPPKPTPVSRSDPVEKDGIVSPLACPKNLPESTVTPVPSMCMTSVPSAEKPIVSAA